jgi:peptidoglycan hydrolase-like protein with peptidoglycan-binding domain
MTHALRQDAEPEAETDLDDVSDDDLEDDDLEEVEDGDEPEEEDDEERVEAAYEPGSHPHAPAGSPTGGQFTTTGGSGSSSKPAKRPAKTAKPAPHKPGQQKPAQPHRKIPDGQLGFDGTSGTGYGKPDDRVKTLQQQLNRLHFTDGAGKKLRADGEFGPLTTTAVKAAQAKLGMNQTGIVDPAFIARLQTLPTPKRATKPKVKASGRVEAAALLDIELARPGTWELASGTTTFTVEMLQDAARYAAKHADARNALKLGHVDPRFDGEPAFGWLANADVYFDEDDRGPVLKARQLDGMPDWLAATAKDAWPNRSVEGWMNYADSDGEEFSFVLDGLALLGVTPPGIGSIRSLRDLPAALGIAASAAAQRVIARAPTAAPVATTAPAPEAEEPPITPEETGMDPAKIREALGLSADASDEEVTSTLTAAGYVPAAPAPVAASVNRDAPGTMRVDASAWQEREDRLKRLEAAMQKSRDNERDQIIASAVKDGKFAPARKVHWARLWDADPEGTREVIAGLAKGVMPTAELGYADGETEADELYTALYGKQKVG